MNLVVDVGNTRTKYAFFDGLRLVETGYDIAGVFEKIGQWKEQGEAIGVLLSGSGKIDEGIRLLLKELAEFWIEAGPHLPLPVKIGYSTPETLGFDRIAICAGGITLFPGKPLLVIDSGTAITFNYVSGEGVFLGGNISPGQEMRFRGLHQFTAKLPYVLPEMNYGGMGRTTEEAVRNGVMNGILFEVEKYIECFYQEEGTGQVLVTGGNGYFLKSRLNDTVVFSESLGFVGLNVILEHNKRLTNN